MLTRGEKQRLIWAYKILFLDVLQLSGHIFCAGIWCLEAFFNPFCWSRLSRQLQNEQKWRMGPDTKKMGKGTKSLYRNCSPEGAINLFFYKAYGIYMYIYVYNCVYIYIRQTISDSDVERCWKPKWFSHIMILSANHLPPIDLCHVGEHPYLVGRIFPCHKLDRAAAEVLFPQDVPKIIFIDADQAGHVDIMLTDLFGDSSDVFFLGGGRWLGWGWWNIW